MSGSAVCVVVGGRFLAGRRCCGGGGGGVITSGPAPTAASRRVSRCPTHLRPRHRRAARHGRVGDALFAALQPALGSRSVDAYAVNYPASYNFLTTADGANDARDHIAAMADQCPATRLVLGVSRRAPPRSRCSRGCRLSASASATSDRLLALDPGLAGKVAAVAVFGNPGNRFSTPLSSTGQFAGRAIDLCSPGDPVCTVGGRDRDAHQRL